jgi:spermidine/putrescine transport system permease protein
MRRGLAALPFLLPGTAVLVVFVAAPILLITTYAFLERNRFGGIEWTFTLENFARVFDPLYLGVIGQSIVTALGVTALALLLGYPTALVIARLPARWQTVALIAVLLPFWTNFLIRTYALILLLNNAGWINGALQGLGITQDPIALLYTPGAVVTGLLYLYLPLMILPLYSSLAGQDRELAEAATNLGSSPWRVFRTVTLPLSLPGALTGCIFVLVPSMGNFVIPERQVLPRGQPRARSVPEGAGLAVRGGSRPRARPVPARAARAAAGRGATDHGGTPCVDRD